MRWYGIWWRGVLRECIKRVAVHPFAAAQCPRAWRFFRYNRAASNPAQQMHAINLLVCGVALGALTAILLMLFLPPLQGIASASLYGKYLFLLIIPTFCATSNVVLNAQLKCRRDKAGLLYMGFYALGSAALCGLLTVKSIPALMNTPDMLRLAVMAVCYALTSGALAAWLSLPEESSE